MIGPDNTGRGVGDGGRATGGGENHRAGADPQPARLHADGVGWGVAGARILAEVALTAEPGATVGLLGPNGSGKSSLLRLLAGLARPDSGRVLLDDVTLGAIPRRALAQRIAVVTQQAATDVEMSALEVVLLGRTPYRSRLAGIGVADLDLARRALAEAGLAGFEQRRWASLSGGERQRVDLARAMVQEPDLLLLDEPTNHLDIRYQLELLRFLAESATTVVVTLHDLNLAAQYCDRLVLLYGGRVVAAGTPVEVLTTSRIEQVYQVPTDVDIAADGRPRIRYRRRAAHE
ncbi:ABC transporter ATP-binding protein [Micromonospora parathelypteridis]|uniref:Iron complex transport system ATP-binding protein n=1 Tax=Micromonospora parathelypteridis TaxID=1839617 RepID=A0A840VY84_9ACTN|nr:ABC transporter ATP-binding protein [Micromonospora parathelypteridis]MBB5480946.1 iron complex transport system ATP-binding protein [Micromonospora parathelypteridis]GGO20842.1 ABC transporter ATP-binding protein [Micromonospora parathelypteridis]